MDVRFYLSIFMRRLPYFLIVATVISAASVTAALKLPPAYESRTQIIVESPQIPQELAQSTVRVSPIEQLQLLENKLLTRDNMLDIARRLNVFPDVGSMNADQIVAAMRARTTLQPPRGRNTVPLMTMVFEAPSPTTAAAVLNEYLTLVQQEDVEFRRGRSGETLEFFEQEVRRLSEDLDERSAQILQYKQSNTNALPESLDFRLRQLNLLQERISEGRRDIADLRNQRERLLVIFEQSNRIDEDATPAAIPLTPQQQELANLREQLQTTLLTFAPGSPRVRLLEARILQLEELIANSAAAPEPNAISPDEDDLRPSREEVVLGLQLDEIDTRIEALEERNAEAATRIEELELSIEATPEVAITLDELQRRFDIVQAQYQQAEQRLNAARTGDIIETRSRGQRISVIAQPAVPSQPTKPNRMLIAGGGTALGIIAGLGLVILLELLNGTARRPEDLVSRFGITPFTTIPYIRTRGQTFRHRSVKFFVILGIIIGVPLAVFAVHTYYLPLDLVADRIMNRLGVRW